MLQRNAGAHNVICQKSRGALDIALAAKVEDLPVLAVGSRLAVGQ